MKRLAARARRGGAARAGRAGDGGRARHRCDRSDADGGRRRRPHRLPLDRHRPAGRARHGPRRDDGRAGIPRSSTASPPPATAWSCSTTRARGSRSCAAGKLTIRRMGQNVDRLVRALRLRRPDVVGWSMGGMIAQSYAVRHPRGLRRLVLLATAPGDGRATPPTAEALARSATAEAATALDLLFPPSARGVARRVHPRGTCAARTRRSLPPPAVANAQVAAAAGWLGGADADGKRVARLRDPDARRRRRARPAAPRRQPAPPRAGPSRARSASSTPTRRTGSSSSAGATSCRACAASCAEPQRFLRSAQRRPCASGRSWASA